MNGAPLLRPPQSFLPDPVGICGVSSDTRGTASRAIKALEAGGYLVRQRSTADGRSVSLRLTNKGKKALARDPFEVLVRAVDKLDAKERTAIHHALHQVLTTVAASGALRCLPGLCPPQWRDVLQSSNREPLGPSMPIARRLDPARGRGSSLRLFSGNERAPPVPRGLRGVWVVAARCCADPGAILAEFARVW